MKLSIRGSLYTGHRPYPYTSEETIKRLAAIGWKSIEWVVSPTKGSLNYDDAVSAKSLRKMLDEYGLECSTISARGYLNKASPIKTEREQAIKDEINIMEVGHELGAKVRVWGAGRIVWGLANREQTWEFAKETINGTLDSAEENGITLALEPQLADSNLILEPEAAIRLMKEVGSKNFKLMIDTLHQYSTEKSPISVRRPLTDWVTIFGKDLVHVHFRAGGSGGERPFSGNIGLPDLHTTKLFLDSLRSIGYDKYICCELMGFDVDLIAKGALEYMTPLIL